MTTARLSRPRQPDLADVPLGAVASRDEAASTEAPCPAALPATGPDSDNRVGSVRQCVDCGATRPAAANHPRARCRPCHFAHVRATAPDRFWASLDRSQGEDGCWLWTGKVDKDGYGQRRPHRKAYGLRYGLPIPPLLRHTCDNPPCCNPRHLIPGTQADNIRDRDERGRTARGDRSGTRLHPEIVRRGQDSPVAKLTDVAVALIRELLATGHWTHREIARIHGVSRTTVTAINLGQNWNHHYPRLATSRRADDRTVSPRTVRRPGGAPQGHRRGDGRSTASDRRNPSGA